jgi:hypothetical protein
MASIGISDSRFERKDRNQNPGVHRLRIKFKNERECPPLAPFWGVWPTALGCHSYKLELKVLINSFIDKFVDHFVY